MTEKYLAYIQMLAIRDNALSTLAMMALGVVMAWEVVVTLPAPWPARLRSFYLAAGMGAYLLILIALYFFQGAAV